MIVAEKQSALESYLESQGFEVNLWGGMCPFQIEANHKTGISVYFRSRHTIASLDIYSEHYDYVSGLPADNSIVWSSEFECWEDPDAGYLDPDEAFYVFYFLWNDAKDFVLN